MESDGIADGTVVREVRQPEVHGMPDHVVKLTNLQEMSLLSPSAGLGDEKVSPGPSVASTEPLNEAWESLIVHESASAGTSSTSNRPRSGRQSPGGSTKDNSELIREASAAAIRDAINMKRSDSDLSPSEDDDNEDEDAQNAVGAYPLPSSSAQRSPSLRYMEEASYEAALLSETHHQLQPSGRLGRQRMSSQEVVDVREGAVKEGGAPQENGSDVFDSDGESNGDARDTRQSSGRNPSQIFFHSSSKTNLPNAPFPPRRRNAELPTDRNQPNYPGIPELSAVLGSCGMAPQPIVSGFSEEAYCLHALFDGFCSPPLTVACVEQILEIERGTHHDPVDLPVGVVVQTPSSSLLEVLSTSLLKLPQTFALGLFRILLRLLSGNTDEEYDILILNVCPWYEEVLSKLNGSKPCLQDALMGRNIGQQQRSTGKSSNGLASSRDDTHSALVYSVVRFRAHFGDAVRKALGALELVLSSKEASAIYLVAPLTRLVGLLCGGGVAVDELRRMIALASDSTHALKTRLLMVRSLTVAASTTVRSSSLVGKMSPRSFFSFVSGPGIARTISLEKSSWPFRNDFGMAVWFRAEIFSESSTILRVSNEVGNGMEVHFLPLREHSSDHTSAALLAVSVLEHHRRETCIKVTKCLLHPRVWYHVAVRHTRSRLKGVFSLSTREHLTVLVDGKPMLSESLAFPQIHDASSKSLSFAFGETFDGQAGTIYVFHDNISDATFKALCEVTSETNGVSKVTPDQGEWDTRHEGIAQRSKILDLNIKQDDFEEIALSHRNYTEGTLETPVIDLGKNEENTDGANPLSKSSFISRLYLVWDPRRTEGSYQLDLHSGAHVRLNHANNIAWSIESAQQVIGSLGGVQALLPIHHSALDQNEQLSTIDQSSVGERGLFDMIAIYSFVPELLCLLSSYVRGSDQNARELLRCGAIEIVEQLLLSNRSNAVRDLNPLLHTVSLVDALFIFPRLSTLLVEALLEIRASTTHCIGLETRIFTRLLFNVRLWFGTSVPGIALYRSLLPVLSNIVRRNPEKVAVCVGAGDLIFLMKELVEIEGSDDRSVKVPLLTAASGSLVSVQATLTIKERHSCIDIMLALVFQIFLVGSRSDDVASLLHLLSKYLEYEWEEASKDVSEGVVATEHSGSRHERYLFSKKCSTVLLFLLTNRSARDLLSNFAAACGSVQGGAAWILSSLVNSYCDYIRGIGVRTLVAYVQATTKGVDMALSLGKPSATELETRSGEARKRQEKTTSLISNVGQGLLNSNVGKGLVSVGTSGRSKTLPLGKLTPRVVFKLLWHLVKSHRFRLGMYTQGALVSMVFQRKEADSLMEPKSIVNYFLSKDANPERSTQLDLTWAEVVMGDSSVGTDATIREGLGISTVMRLLRFLPQEYAEQWLSDLVGLSKDNSSATSISSHPDWQPCLFQFISELLENIVGQVVKDDINSFQDEKRVEAKTESRLGNQYLLSLELYGLLLGNLVRSSSEVALSALEEAAALQRVFVNGPEVFSLILSNFIENLSLDGVTMIEENLILDMELPCEDPSMRLKHTAKMVTNAILKNGEQGMNLTFGVASWRCLRHLTVVTAAFVSSLGESTLGTESTPESLSTPQSGVLGGLRLTEGRVGNFHFANFVTLHARRSRPHSHTTAEESSMKDSQSRLFLRTIGFHLSAQLLSLLDVFIFPEDTLEAAVATSQLHGLALVRGTETRLGTSQGPLLASLMRLSLLLVSDLQPFSVELLRSCSRLRCFVHYSLELMRESQAMEGYSGSFNKLTLPFDRLLLVTVVECQRTLRKCGAALQTIESKSDDTLFLSKESQKKSYRRLMRIAAELREILITIHETRRTIFRDYLSQEAYLAFQSSMDAALPPEREGEKKVSSPKENLVRGLLASEWVTLYSCGLSEANLGPRGAETSLDLLADFTAYKRNTSSDSTEITRSFEKSLITSFESYLENQRKWAETSAVRDLEFEGDTILKNLSRKWERDYGYLQQSLLDAAVSMRWMAVNNTIGNLWRASLHWKLPNNVDRCGRRVILVRASEREFNDHAAASYDLMMGRDRVREENERDERMLQNEISDLIKRNADAFVPFDGNDLLDEEEDEDEKGYASLAVEKEYDSPSVGASKSPENDAGAEVATIGDGKVERSKNPDTSGIDRPACGLSIVDAKDVPMDVADAWIRGFIWEDGESIVARFSGVVLVTLQHHFEGDLLLSTHGLYFHQVGDGVNVVSRDTIASSTVDRRWRLNRLTEVHGRRYMLRQQAIELFFADSHELFLNFCGGQRERNRFYAKLRNSCKTPLLFSAKTLNPRAVFKKSKYTALWRKRQLSTYDYVMALNRMSGRTFNDISQYPVFPWILADYTSEKIDLSDSRIYRDLSKPIGALNPDRLALLLERYNELESFGFSAKEKFLYGSHYSSPGIVLHFLIRQEPFTSMAIDLQSGKFDCPDRLFFDFETTWNSCNTSSGDVKELVPELYTAPEILMNTNGFPLGQTQRGVCISDLILPPWAKGSPHEFVRMHRLALESEHVSKNLHHWIDLIFGYKQRGPAAEAAHNLFHHLSYEGAVDLEKIGDELDRKAAESHIQHFGQTPSQLIATSPHPSRYRPDECWKPLINNMSTAVRLRCHTPSQQFGGKKGCGAVAGAVASIFVQADALLVVYADLKVGAYKWAPTGIANRLRPEKLRALPSLELSHSRAAIKRGSAAPHTMDESTSRLAVGHWSFAVTIGGYEKEQVRRKSVMPSRLASAKDALYTDAAPLIVSCGYWDNTLKVHSTDSWKLESSETGGHRGPIRCLAIGSDGGLLVTGGEDCTCRVWVVDYPDMAVAISDGYMQTSLGRRTSGDQILSCCHVLWGHDYPISCVDLSCALDIVVSGSLDGKICVHTLRKGDFIRFFNPSICSMVSIDTICLESHGRMVIQMADHMLYTYTVNGVCLCSIDAGERIHDMKISGEVLVTGGENCHVYIRNLTNLKVLSGLDLSRHGPIRTVTLTPDDLNPIPQYLFIGSDDGMISIVEHD